MAATKRGPPVGDGAGEGPASSGPTGENQARGVYMAATKRGPPVGDGGGRARLRPGRQGRTSAGRAHGRDEARPSRGGRCGPSCIENLDLVPLPGLRKPRFGSTSAIPPVVVGRVLRASPSFPSLPMRLERGLLGARAACPCRKRARASCPCSQGRVRGGKGKNDGAVLSLSFREGAAGCRTPGSSAPAFAPLPEVRLPAAPIPFFPRPQGAPHLVTRHSPLPLPLADDAAGCRTSHRGRDARAPSGGAGSLEKV